jgi:hypothetical protein
MSSSTLAARPLLDAIAGDLDAAIAELTPRHDPERRERVARAERDMEFFANYYFPHLVKAPFAPFHRETWRESKAVEPECRDDVRVAPREHAKTTALSFIPSMHRIVFQHERFILWVSDTDPIAADRVLQTKVELETNERLRADFGDLVGKLVWRQDCLVTSTGIRITSIGTGSQVRGILDEGGDRPSLIIADDIENDEHVEDELQRAKTERWFSGALVNALGKRGHIWVRGTILHHRALLKVLLDEKRIPGKLYRAEEKGTGRVLWPEWWPAERLAKRRRMIGSFGYEKEFNQHPIDPSTQPFKKEFFTYFRPEALSASLMHYGGVDPAISLKKTASQFAVADIVTVRGVIYVCEIYRDRLSFRRQVLKVLEYYRRTRAMIGIEAVAYQKALEEQVAAEGDLAQLWPSVKPVPAIGSKDDRVMTLQPAAERGAVRFAKHLRPLVEDVLVLWPDEGKDVWDAIYHAVEMARSHGPVEFESTGVKTEGAKMLEAY